jgi:RimJ/RimL family protein N-acetyltransferase
VSDQLPEHPPFFGAYGLGAIDAETGEPVLGIIIHDFEPMHRSLMLSIVVIDKRVITRRLIRTVADLCYNKFGANRIEVMIRRANTASISLATRLGFDTIGVRRQYSPDGDDMVLMELLREDCPWVSEPDDEVTA